MYTTSRFLESCCQAFVHRAGQFVADDFPEVSEDDLKDIVENVGEEPFSVAAETTPLKTQNEAG